MAAASSNGSASALAAELDVLVPAGMRTAGAGAAPRRGGGFCEHTGAIPDHVALENRRACRISLRLFVIVLDGPAARSMRHPLFGEGTSSLLPPGQHDPPSAPREGRRAESIPAVPRLAD